MAGTRYHIHPQTGVPGKCRAQVSCPFGDLETEHYATPEAARAAFEETMTEAFVANLRGATPAVLLLREKGLALEEGDRRSLLLKLASQQAAAQTAAARGLLKWRLALTQEEFTAVGREDLAEVVAWSQEASSLGVTIAPLEQEVARAQDALKRHEEYLPDCQKLLEAQEEALRLAEEEQDEMAVRGCRNKVFTFKQRVAEMEDGIAKARGALAQAQEALAKTRAADEAQREELLRKEFTAQKRELTHEDKVFDGINEFTFTTPEGRATTVRQELSAVPYNYVGKLSLAQGKALEVVQGHASALTKLLEQEGKFELPKAGLKLSTGQQYTQQVRDELFPPRDGFRLVAAGGENNVYLHEPTQMVYKVPHKQSLLFPGAKGQEAKVLQRAVHLSEERYAEVEDSLEMTKAFGQEDVEYLKTYFLQTKDAKGQVVPVVAQPLLDPAVHKPLDPAQVDQGMSSTLKGTLLVSGFQDLHEGNVFYNEITGKVVLFDCLLLSPTDREADYREQGLI